MFLKLMGVEDLPDTDQAKSFQMVANVDRVGKTVYEKDGVLRVDLLVVFSNPSKCIEERLTLQANAYLMNDAGKTIDPIPAFPGRPVAGNWKPQNPLGNGWMPDGQPFNYGGYNYKPFSFVTKNMSVRDLPLSPLAINLLGQHNISTAEKLASMTANKLREIFNGAMIPKNDWDYIEQLVINFGPNQSPPPARWNSKPVPHLINQLDLASTTVKRLHKAGIMTIAQLTALTAIDLKNMVDQNVITTEMYLDIGSTLHARRIFQPEGTEAVALPVDNSHLGQPLSEVTDVEFLRSQVIFLWGIIDDIDTTSDVVRGNDTAYRAAVETLQSKRHDYISSDGHNLFINKNSTSPETKGNKPYLSREGKFVELGSPEYLAKFDSSQLLEKLSFSDATKAFLKKANLITLKDMFDLSYGDMKTLQVKHNAETYVVSNIEKVLNELITAIKF